MTIWEFVNWWIIPRGVSRFIGYRPSGPRAESTAELIDRIAVEGRSGDLGKGWETFRELSKSSRRYLEWGVGRSTFFMAANRQATVKAVECDKEWAEGIRSQLDQGSVDCLYVDLGETGRWGRPTTFDKHSNFRDYLELPFSDGYNPDLILIDGRFRVACFLTALKLASPGTIIVFDDYVGRSHYHFVERFLRPEKSNGRQGIFVRPEVVDLHELDLFISKFEFVMD